MTEKSYSRLDSRPFAYPRLRGLRVAIVGLGATGSEVAKCLGLVGLGEVLLIDPDTVAATNLGLFYTDAVGRPKADVLAERAQATFPATDWHPIREEIADVGWGRLERCDLLFGAVDRDSARLELARIGTRLGIPVCDGGLATKGTGRGRVTWYPAGREAACFGCRLTARRRREMLTSWQSSVHPCIVPPDEPGGWTSTPAMASIIGAWQVDLAVRTLAEPVAAAFSVEVEIAPGVRCEQMTIPRSEACPFHAEKPALMPGGEGPFEAWMEEEGVGWEWSLCLSARCLDCGTGWRPRQRVTRLMRTGKCPKCGGQRIRAGESLREVRRGTASAKLTPGDLGLPPDHLYTKGTRSSPDPAGLRNRNE